MFRISGRTRWRGFFFMSPGFHTISFGFLLLSRQLDCGPLTVPFRRFVDLIKDNQKVKSTALVVRWPCLFFLSFDFARSPTGAKPPDAVLRARLGVRRRLRARCESTTAGHLCRSCMPWVRCHARLHGLSSPLVLRSPWLRPVVLSQHGHRLQ